ERGIPAYDLKAIGTTEKSGTTITFKADPKVFTETTHYHLDTLRNRIQQLAFLNKGLKIELVDARESEVSKEVFHYEGGIIEYVQYLNQNKSKIHTDVIYIEKEQEGITLEIALQYVDSYTANLYSFANNIN